MKELKIGKPKGLKRVQFYRKILFSILNELLLEFSL